MPIQKDNVGRIYTCSINSSGTITSVDDGVFETTETEHPNMISLGGSAFAVAYRGVGNDGFLVTISISSLGIVGSIIESLEFFTTDARTPFIIYLGYGNYAITYGAQNEDDVECVTVGVTTAPIVTTQTCTDVVGATAIGRGVLQTWVERMPPLTDIVGTHQ